MTDIIAELHNGQWSAWFSDRPQIAFGGRLPSIAVARLLESAGLNPTRIAGRHDAATDTHLEYFIPSSPCPDCRGSGRYAGLNTVSEPISPMMRFNPLPRITGGESLRDSALSGTK